LRAAEISLHASPLQNPIYLLFESIESSLPRSSRIVTRTLQKLADARIFDQAFAGEEMKFLSAAALCESRKADFDCTLEKG
jgi:hypothetical protein